MKKILSIITATALVAASCNTNPRAGTDATKVNTTTTDTTGFAQFQQWKAQHELADPNQYGQTTQSSKSSKQTVVYVPERRTYSPSRRTVYTSSSSNTAKVYRKKGWSSAAKGAVIGGGTGAILGAVINKRNRVLGGVVGGVLGAGAGYGIGRHIDKKNGRY